MKKFHYVYKIINNNPQDQRKFYIGVRSSKIEPELDTKYQSSSKYLKHALKEIGHKNFHKEILSLWKTRKLANREEARLHELFDVAKNPEFYNKSKARDNGFCTEGMVTVIDIETGERDFVTTEEANNPKYTKIHFDKVNVIDIETGERLRVSKEEFRNNSRYENILKGVVTAIDTTTGNVRHVSKEEFDNDEKLVGQLKGKVNAIDIRNGKGCSISKEEFEKYDYYIHATKDTLRVVDTRDKTMKRVTIEEYNKHSYFVSPNSKLVEVYDSKGILQHSVFNGFKEYCKEHNLPFNAFSVSKQNNGQPLYVNSGSNENKLKRQGYWIYKGWYAINKSV